jgi:hypothetical protein
LRTSWWELGDDQRRSRILGLLREAPPAIATVVAALSKGLGEAAAFEPLRMSAEWRNVTLVPGAIQNVRPAFGANVVGLSRRLGEARWRWIARSFQIPAPILHLLSQPAGGEHYDFHAQRADLVRRHVEHLAVSPNYSPIGLARVYLT